MKRPSDETALPAKHFVAPRLGAAIVLAVGLLLSLVLWQHAGKQAAQDAQTQLDHRVNLALAGIGRNIEEFNSLLLGMQGLFLASEQVTRREFKRYTDNLRLHGRTDGIRALHFTRLVSGRDKAAFIAAVRGDRSLTPHGYPEFSIHPEGRRNEYFVIEYIEPLQANRAAFGLDSGTQPVNSESFLDARDSGEIRLTPPFQIVQNKPNAAGLVLRAPVYRYGSPQSTIEERRTALVGFVGITLNAADLFHHIFADPSFAGLRVVIRDAGPAVRTLAVSSGGQTILDSGNTDGAATLSIMRELHVAGRLWQLDFSASGNLLADQPGRPRPLLFFAIGALFSLLLAGLYFALARSRASAFGFARRMTGDLRRSEERFRTATDVSSEWYWEQDSEHRVVDFIGRAYKDAGLDFERARGKTRWELAPDALSPEEWAAHRAVLAARQPFRLRYQMRSTNGTLRWLESKGQPRFDDKGEFVGYHGTGRDITEQIEAEARLKRQAALLRTILEHMNQGISVVDADLNMLAANRRFFDLLGFPEGFIGEGMTVFEEVVRYNAERGEYGSGDIEQLVRERVELAKKFLPHRIKRTRPDGTVLDIVGTPLPGGGMVTTYTDITEQERIAAEIRRETGFQPAPDRIRARRLLPDRSRTGDSSCGTATSRPLPAIRPRRCAPPIRSISSKARIAN